jgi:hypothetical protein
MDKASNMHPMCTGGQPNTQRKRQMQSEISGVNKQRRNEGRKEKKTEEKKDDCAHAHAISQNI